ncbi:hypothetical protein [Thalassotalea sp. PLHSN55]|uniref:hypothetical protein n=1 Tax=Thalassotalea sp. PLHSN55 TaxID=3435888 RepID=UPI003F854806
MESTLWLKIYRVLAIAIVALPIILNWLLEGSLLSSLLYVPIVSLAFGGLAIWLDRQLLKFAATLTRRRAKPVASAPKLSRLLNQNSKSNCCFY